MPPSPVKIDLSSLDASAGFRLNGAPGGQSGLSVASAGDVNGDGFADLIVGARFADPNGSNSGASYVVFGKASGFGLDIDLTSLDGSSGFQLNGEAEYDYSGTSVASAGDVNGDGFADVIVGAPYADANGVLVGASYIVFGKASGFVSGVPLSSLDGSNGFRLEGAGDIDRSGRSVASAGDVNGDGYGDLIVGAPYANSNGSLSGASYVVFGKATGFAAGLSLSNLDGTNGFRLDGAADDLSGHSVASAGDVNGDGFADLIVGATDADPNGGNSGTSYVVFGAASGFASSLFLSSLDGSNGFKLQGAAAYDASGFSVASAGDVNGDGFADLIVGAPYADYSRGASYVVFGMASGFGSEIDLSSLDGSTGFRLSGGAPYGHAGRSVASAGDVNGDGFSDVIVGAPDANGSGASYVVFGRASGFAANISLSGLAAVTGFEIEGTAFSATGTSVASAGDVNGDGYDDLIVGSPGASTSYVVFGRRTIGVQVVGLSADSGASTSDFLTNVASQTVSGLYSGKLDAGDLIEVSADGGTTWVAATAAGGSWSAAGVMLSPGSGILSTRVVDLAGNATAGPSQAYALDTTEPLAVADVVGLSDDSGASAGDFVTNVASQTVSGTYFDPLGGNEQIQVSADGGMTWLTATADAGTHTWFAAGVTLSQGDGFLSTRTIDRAGNTTAGATQAYTLDTTAPPAAANIDIASLDADTGASASDFLTNVASQMVSGTYDGTLAAGEVIEVSADGGTTWVTATAAGGTWSAAGVTLSPGSGVLSTRLIDLAGNETAGASHAYTLDTTGPLAVAGVGLSSLDPDLGFRLSGAPGEMSGYSVASAGDVNGDGFADLVVGTPRASPHGNASGASYVVFGKASGFGSDVDLASLDGDSGFKLSGVAFYDLSGYSVASAGDVNGDGFDDVIVGAPHAQAGATNSGASYVVFGKASGFASNIELSSLNGSTGFRLGGVAQPDQSGTSVASAGDVNGDGYDDLIVGAPNANGTAGASYIVFGKASGFTASIGLSTLDGSNGFRLDGAALLDRSGWSVASAGDVDGDGYGDLIVGAPAASPNGDHSGASYVVFGKASGFAADVDLSSLDGSSGFKLSGVAAYDQTGISVASAGDVNGDGFADLIVGAWLADPNGAQSGASYVVFGKASGFGSEIGLSSLDGTTGFKLSGGATNDYSGRSVASAGDVNGDGYDDLIVGAPRVNGGQSGASYVVFGKASGFAADIDLSSLDSSTGFEIEGAPGSTTGTSVASAGDVNGDGLADLIVGSPGISSSYVLFGRQTIAVRVTGLSADNGASAGDFRTNVAPQTVSGTYVGKLDADDLIQVSADGGATWATATAAAGIWSAAGVTLLPGSGFLSTRVVDLAGNATAGPSQAYTLDTAAPAVVIAPSATVGATSLPGTAVTLSGTASDDGSGPISVAIYNGAIAPANLIGTAGVTAGTWSLSTTLAAGTYGPFIAMAADAAGNTSSSTGTFRLQTAIARAAYTAIETLFVGGIPTTRNYIKADGSIAFNASLNSDGTINVLHYSGIVGKAYTGYDVVYGANGKPVSALYSNGMTATWVHDSSGKLQERVFSNIPGEAYDGYTVVYGPDGKAASKTFLLADGLTYRVQTWNPDGTLHEDHRYGVMGKPYTDVETVYGAGGERLSTTYFKADGSILSIRTWNADGTLHALHQFGIVGRSYTDVETVYGAGGERVSATYSDGMTATWSYYPSGMLEEVRYQDVTGKSYTVRENDYDASGDLAVTSFTYADGSRKIVGRQDGLILSGTAANERFIGGGVDETFLFTASPFGHDTLSDFAAHIAGSDHDTLVLPGTSFASFVELLAATTFSAGGALITVDAGNTIYIPKLTETVMTANAASFSFSA